MGARLVDLFFVLVPFVAGVIVGGARRLWWLNAAHDSVLRHAHLAREESHVALRGFFCSIVNGKRKLIDAVGREVHPLVSAARFYGVVIGAAVLVLLLALPFRSGAHGFLEVLKGCLVLGAAVLWGAFKMSLASSRHRTILAIPEPGPMPPSLPFWRWRPKGKLLYLRAERAEDGLPTKSIESVPAV